MKFLIEKYIVTKLGIWFGGKSHTSVSKGKLKIVSEKMYLVECSLL